MQIKVNSILMTRISPYSNTQEREWILAPYKYGGYVEVLPVEHTYDVPSETDLRVKQVAQLHDEIKEIRKEAELKVVAYQQLIDSLLAIEHNGS